MTITAHDIPVWIDPQDTECWFPDISLALTEPNGLLAIGGNLSAQCLLSAYEHGIFPWYSDNQPILWWSPDPRSVLFPNQLKVSRSLTKTINKNIFTITLDTAFAQVIEACSAPRPDAAGTWITREMKEAYCLLFELGHAHSAEAWFNGELAGGLYGVAIGRVFFGESMFYRQRDASKAAFIYLVRQLNSWGYRLIDCQIASQHLANLGAREIGRREFCQILADACKLPGHPAPWQFDDTFNPAVR
jgi:leucyl/phenylalanyl-tRNA--protein transferase